MDIAKLIAVLIGSAFTIGLIGLSLVAFVYLLPFILAGTAILGIVYFITKDKE